MIRSLVSLLVLVVAVLYFPLWLVISLFVVAVLVVRHRVLLFIPAVFSDVLYSPVGHISIAYSTMTFLVAGLLIAHWLIFTQTRLAQVFYGLEKE